MASPFAGTAPVGAALGAGPPGPPGSGDVASISDAGAMSPSRSYQLTDAYLMDRCKQAVGQCRRDLDDLRAACKAATSHREKCAELSSAATEAVVALEDLLWDPLIDLRRERQLQQLAGKVQNAIDQGEATVKVHGYRSGLMMLACCSSGAPLKLEASIIELTNHAKQARLMSMQHLPAGRLVSGNSMAMDSVHLPTSAAGQSSQPAGLALAPASSGGILAPGSPSPTARSVLAQSVPEGSALGAEQNSAAPAPSGPQDSMMAWGDRAVPEEAMQETRIRKGGGKAEVTAVVHVPPPPDRPSHLGYLWYFVTKTFGHSSLVVWDLSGRVESEVREGRQSSDVSCMHYDDVYGYVWTGHTGGHIRVWSADKQESLCPAFKAFGSGVQKITTDEHGFCWAGSDKGKVRSYRLVMENVDGIDMGYRVMQRGELMWQGDGVPMPPVGSMGASEEGFLTHALWREGAHYGPVRCLAAVQGRVWTCGGTSAFANFREWTQSGLLLKTHDMRPTGLINDMVLVTPVVVVEKMQSTVVGAQLGTSPGTGSAVLSSFTGSASAPLASRFTVSQMAEVTMSWQLLTAHDGGFVQVWADIDQRLVPLLRVGDRGAPAQRAIICEPLGILITAHPDGKLRLRSIPHPHSPSGLKITLKEKDMHSISNASLACAQLGISKTGSGLVHALGGCLGVVTVSSSSAIKHLPIAELRRVAQEAGINLLGPLAAADPSQWPVRRLSSIQVQTAVEEAAMWQQQYSTEMEEDLHTERDASEAQERSTALSGETNAWIIDWTDLTRSRIIGEGAFGKVWLGRWQETDVAIKQLGSLSALGVETGSLQHDSSGGIKLDHDVKRALDKEVGLLIYMRHPNIILFMGVVLEPPAVVTEYCARGSLYDLLKEARNRPALAKALDWSRRVVMALDAAKGMLYLHSNKPPIIHRDLKSPNLLVTKDWRVKVTDFNLSRQTTPEGAAANSVQSMVANNPRWQPPEVISHQHYDKASDVYAFGLVLWELLTWELPFAELSNFQIMLAVTQQGRRPQVKDQWAAAQYPGGTFAGYEEYVALMQRCWADDPAARPTFEQIITDLRKVAKILADSRGPARPGGPMLLASQSRNFARQAQLLAAAGSRPSASGSGAAAPGQAPMPVPATPAGAAPVSPAAVGAAVAAAAAAGGAAAVAARPFVDSAYAGPIQQQQQHVGTPPSVAGSSMAAQPRSEAGTDPSLSAAPSGSVVMGGAASGGSMMSNAPPPPSPFGSSPATPTVVSSNAAMPAGPFGGGPAPWLQQAPPAFEPATVSSAAPPEPSPFGGAAISSAAPPPPSPFDSAPTAAGGQAISSAAQPPPPPFGSAPATAAAAAVSAPLAGSQTISSAAPPPRSPFDSTPAAADGQTISSAAPPPLSPFDSRPAHPLSPYAAHLPADVIPASEHRQLNHVPSTVLEASASVEAAAAAAGGGAEDLRSAPCAAAAAEAEGGRGAGDDSGSGSTDERAGNGGQSLVQKLRHSLSGSGKKKLTRMPTL